MKKFVFLFLNLLLISSCTYNNLNKYQNDLSSLNLSDDKYIVEVPDFCNDIQKDLLTLSPNENSDYTDEDVKKILNMRKIPTNKSTKDSLNFYYDIRKCKNVYDQIKDNDAHIKETIKDYYQQKRSALANKSIGWSFRALFSEVSDPTPPEKPELEKEVTTYYMQKINERYPGFSESVNNANKQDENFDKFGKKLKSYFYDLDSNALFKSYKLKMCSFDLIDLFIRYHSPFFSIDKYKDCIFQNYSGTQTIVAINNGSEGTLFTNYAVGGDIIFVYGNYKYRTEERLKRGFFKYTGRYTYPTVLGTENTVDSFKEIDFNKITSNLYFLNKFYYN